MRPGHACLGKLADALTYIRNSANGFNEAEAPVPRKTGLRRVTCPPFTSLQSRRGTRAAENSTRSEEGRGDDHLASGRPRHASVGKRWFVRAARKLGVWLQ